MFQSKSQLGKEQLYQYYQRREVESIQIQINIFIQLVQTIKENKIKQHIESLEKLCNQWLRIHSDYLVQSSKDLQQEDTRYQDIITQKQQLINEFIRQLQENFIRDKIYETITLSEIEEFFNKVVNNIKSKMDLQDDIMKLRLLSNYPKLTKRTYSREASLVLKGWLLDHFEHPYPSKDDIVEMIIKTGLTEKQILNWFINSRNKFRNRAISDKSFKLVVAQRFEELQLQKKRKLQ